MAYPTETTNSRGTILGLAIGDALGTTVEFKPRDSFTPVTDITGGGPFSLPLGAWTDDTSMALCLAESLVESDGFDPGDQMDRYVKWFQEGYLSSTGHCFDIGNTTHAALQLYKSTGEPFSGSPNPGSSGNGSIMRLAPVPIYYRSDITAAINYSAESSRTTHGATTCLDGCKLLGAMIVKAISGEDKETILSDAMPSDTLKELHPSIREIAIGSWKEKTEDEIRGSGYVVESLEAAIWCFARTNSFSEAVLRAVNLGDDADTTGAVCGQLAGAYYGVDGIPQDWLEKLVMLDRIEELIDRLVATSGTEE